MPQQKIFGNWSVNEETNTLDYTEEVPYQIPLWEIETSASILDWIYQINEKTWATDEDIRNLIAAFVALFGRGVCSGGVDHPLK